VVAQHSFRQIDALSHRKPRIIDAEGVSKRLRLDRFRHFVINEAMTCVSSFSNVL
jgi:hypothetical protein